MNESEWFASWFDSPYYPILYQHRDYREAEAFVKQLLAHLNPPAESHFLDLACGRGRHSIYIHNQGFQVSGMDLSPDSIRDASLHSKPGLTFKVHDMRDAFPASYHYIFNLFTSFGYFSNQEDNLKVLQNVRQALQPNGTFVMDFMNVEKVIPELVREEEKDLDGIHFTLQRYVDNGFIIKEIHIEDDEHIQHFQERVQALGRPELESLFAKAGLEVVEVWGDYGGSDFSPEFSPRLIYFCR